MTIRDEIIATANQLANQGKKPTVALIKNKLVTPAPLPTIISTLKTWQHEPEKIDLPAVQSKTTDKPDTKYLTKHEAEQLLAPLKQEVAEIKQLINQLIDTQSAK